MIKPFTKNKRTQQSHSFKQLNSNSKYPKNGFNLPTLGLTYNFNFIFYKCLTHFVFVNTESNLT